MKRLSETLDIGPEYVADFELAGIRTLPELAAAKDLQELSRRTNIPLDLVRHWHEQAVQRIAAGRYRLRAAGIVGVVVATFAVWSVGHFRAAGMSRQAKALYAQADAAYDAKNYRRAESLYEGVLRLEPTNQLAYANKGGALHKLGQNKEALTALNKALELNPKDVWALDERGGVYIDLHEYDRAIQDYDRAITLDPKDQLAYANKGFALHKLGKDHDALAALDKALELDPKDVWAFNERGGVHIALQKYDLALRDYDAAIKLDPKDQVAFANRGLALRRQHRYEDAVVSLDKALELDPNDAWAYNERGIIYHDNLYQFEPAYQDLKKAVELDPRTIWYETNLAEATLTSGRFGEAFRAAVRILADQEGTDEKNFGVYDRLAMRFIAIASLLLQGDTAQAKARSEEFIRYYNSVPPNFHRGWEYSSDRRFIERRAMDGLSKDVILNLIQLLEDPPTSTIDRVAALVSRLK